MEKLDALNQVAEFHRTFRHPIEPRPLIPAEQRCRLRVALLAEELKELEKAIENQDIVEVADALCDLQYVLSGAVLEFGLGEHFKTLFDEVQRHPHPPLIFSRLRFVWFVRIDNVQFIHSARIITNSSLASEPGKEFIQRHEERKEQIKSFSFFCSSVSLHLCIKI